MGIIVKVNKKKSRGYGRGDGSEVGVGVVWGFGGC